MFQLEEEIHRPKQSFFAGFELLVFGACSIFSGCLTLLVCSPQVFFLGIPVVFGCFFDKVQGTHKQRAMLKHHLSRKKKQRKTQQNYELQLRYFFFKPGG